GTSSDIGFTSGQLHPDFLQRWRSPGDELNTDVPAYVADASESSTRRDIEYYTRAHSNVLSASFIKLRDITLTYQLPVSFVRQIRTENMSLRFQVSNIMLWRANSYDIDPEFHSPSSGVRTPSVPYMNNPS